MLLAGSRTHISRPNLLFEFSKDRTFVKGSYLQGGVPPRSHRKLWTAVAVPPQTLIGRLPLEQGSDRRETLPKRVSDDSQRFIFRRQKNFIDEIFGSKILFFANLVWFSRFYGRTDVKISFRVKFCSRLTYSQVCTTENHENSVAAAGGGRPVISVTIHI